DDTDAGIFSILSTTLNTYFPAQVPGMPQPTIGFYTGSPADVCEPQPKSTIFSVAFYCPANDTVWVEQDNARTIYDRQDLGDFGVGYVVATAWAEAAMDTLGSTVTGEERALAADCLVGAYSYDMLPASVNGIPDVDPTTNEGLRAVLSPGDLDEAVSTAILAGDDSEDEDDNGTPFQKISSFRLGVLQHFEACQAQFGL
ncbi:MAG: hypothetical protein R2705_22240, partial [Ilumatobacteraceae bacterium]